MRPCFRRPNAARLAVPTSLPQRFLRRRPRRRLISDAAALAALALFGTHPPPAGAADFWWHGDVNASWYGQLVGLSGNITNTNWATSASGIFDPLAHPGPLDLVRFTTLTANNFSLIDTDNASVLGIRTEGSLSADVTLRRLPSRPTVTLTLGTSGVVHNGSGILRFDEIVLTRTGTLDHVFDVSNAAGQIWIGGSGDWLFGARGLTKTGPGTLRLSGTNTYTGGTEIREGTLRVTPSAFPTNSTLRVSQGRFDINANWPSYDVFVGDLLLGDGVRTGPIEITGSPFARMVLSGNISFFSSPSTSRAVINVPVLLGPGQHIVDNPTNSFSNGVYDIVFTNLLNGDGGLTKRGAFTKLALAFNAVYTGPTRLEEGELVIAANVDLGQSDLIMSPGTSLQMAPFTTIGGVTAGNYNLNVGSLSGAGTINLGSATLTVGRNVGFTPNTTFSGNISGTTGGQLVYRGFNATLTLSGLNQYTGGTEIFEGRLRIATPASFPSNSDLRIRRRGIFDLGGNHLTVRHITFGYVPAFASTDSQIIASTHADGTPAGGALTLSGDVNFVFSGDLASAPPGRFHVPVVLSPGTRTLRSSGSMPVNSDDSYEIIFRESVSGPGGLRVEGSLSQPPFDVALVAPSPYTGPTTVVDSTLYLATPNALPNSPITLSLFSSLSLTTLSMRPDPDVPQGSFDQTLTSLSGGGNVTFHGATLTVGDASSTSFSGGFSGDASSRLVKTGTGTWTLGPTSVIGYGGGTRIDNGTLALSHPNSLPTGGHVTVRQGTLHVAAPGVVFGDLVLGDGVSDGPRQVTSASGGSLVLNGNLSYNGRNAVAAPALVDVPITLPLGQHQLNNPNGQYSSAQYDLVLSKPLSGPGGITKTGDTFYVALTASSTYTGPTQIQSGVVYLAATNALPTNTALTLGPDASLLLDPFVTQNGVVAGNYNQRIGSLAGAGFISLGSATLTVGNATSTTFDGLLTGNGGRLVKTGTATLILTANHTFNGGTTVSAGTLQLGNGGTTGALSGDLRTDATVIFHRADLYTFPGAISGAGSVIQTGPGTLRLTGDLTHQGDTTVRNGSTLQLDASLRSRGGRLVVADDSVALLNNKRSAEPTLAAEVNSLVVGKNALARISPTHRAAGFAPATLITDRLLLDGLGFVDLTNNDMLLRGERPERIREHVRTWTIANNGLPGAIGLGSSLAFYLPEGAFTTLAVYDNSVPGHTLPFFNGIETLASDVLVKYTYWGDTNLDGIVDAEDLARLLVGLNGEGSGWNFGDTDHDGEVTFFDLGRTLAALRGQGAPLGDASAYNRMTPPPGGNAIPEPAAGLALLAAAPLLGRPRRTR